MVVMRVHMYIYDRVLNVVLGTVSSFTYFDCSSVVGHLV